MIFGPNKQLKEITDLLCRIDSNCANLSRLSTISKEVIVPSTVHQSIPAYSELKELTELRQKLARMEAVVERVDARRSTEEIMELLHNLNEENLRLDREEQSTHEVQTKIAILNWVLGIEGGKYV